MPLSRLLVRAPGRLGLLLEPFLKRFVWSPQLISWQEWYALVHDIIRLVVPRLTLLYA